MVAVSALESAHHSHDPPGPMSRLFSATTPLRDHACAAAPNPTRKTLFGAGHGREYDSHRGDYYYRYRIHIPEWGQFTGPDMQFEETEPEGACNDLFCGNRPADLLDPKGLSDGSFFAPQRWMIKNPQMPVGQRFTTLTRKWGTRSRKCSGIRTSRVLIAGPIGSR